MFRPLLPLILVLFLCSVAAPAKAEPALDRDLLEADAKAGDACAQDELGTVYRQEGNYAEAVRWWRKAADQGEWRAMDSLAGSYDAGQGAKEDHVEAAKWYRKAAEEGFAFAQTALASKYVRGEGVPQDYTEAAKWLQKAAHQGNVGAKTALGEIYRLGQIDGKPDYAEAYFWYSIVSPREDFLRDEVVKRLTPEEKARADIRFKEWISHAHVMTWPPRCREKYYNGGARP